ncbi:hypothetical protein Patl1_27296 [Pistacia atlantica]|uniref:Uncharacterized protein n=1 Tax=Pistacia atlantica TaxID=434234 RepID=A0ACC1BE40_9ROSI|nr:hypothetical protein Patl1_27296 [Pistacia atlantica]
MSSFGHRKWDKSDYQFVRPPRLTEWYANQSSLAPGVTLDTFEKSSFRLANGASGIAIDVHYYNLYSDTFNNLRRVAEDRLYL